MLEHALRFLLLLEILSYVGVGLGWMALVHVPAGCVALALLAWALGVRAALLALTYVYAWRHASPIPPEQRTGLVRLACEALREYACFVASYSLIQPLATPLMGEDAVGSLPPGEKPLLLIHGYCCNRGYWWWLRRQLRAGGHGVATISLEPAYAGIDDFVEQVAQRIAALLAETGAGQVVLIAHSMGGLVARAYLRRHGGSKVARLITLGTGHHGSVLACLGIGRNARQMEPGSPWLESLARETLPVPTTSRYSRHDNFVMPQASAVLPGARIIALVGVGHLSMGCSPAVLACIEAELNSA